MAKKRRGALPEPKPLYLVMKLQGDGGVLEAKGTVAGSKPCTVQVLLPDGVIGCMFVYKTKTAMYKKHGRNVPYQTILLDQYADGSKWVPTGDTTMAGFMEKAFHACMAGVDTQAMKVSKGKQTGAIMATALTAWLDLMYQKDTATRVLGALIAGLEEAKERFKR